MGSLVELDCSSFGRWAPRAIRGVCSDLGVEEVGGVGEDAKVVGAVVEVEGIDGLAVEVFAEVEIVGAELGGDLFGSEEEVEGLAGGADAGGDGVVGQLLGAGEGFAGKVVIEDEGCAGSEGGEGAEGGLEDLGCEVGDKAESGEEGRAGGVGSG